MQGESRESAPQSTHAIASWNASKSHPERLAQGQGESCLPGLALGKRTGERVGEVMRVVPLRQNCAGLGQGSRVRVQVPRHRRTSARRSPLVNLSSKLDVMGQGRDPRAGGWVKNRRNQRLPNKTRPQSSERRVRGTRTPADAARAVLAGGATPPALVIANPPFHFLASIIDRTQLKAGHN